MSTEKRKGKEPQGNSSVRIKQEKVKELLNVLFFTLNTSAFFSVVWISGTKDSMGSWK